MGGSRRRLKKNLAKVRVGVQKHSKKHKTKLPEDITSNKPSRLPDAKKWAPEGTLTENYAANKLVLDPNALGPREAGGGARPSAALVPPEERIARGEDIYDDDDELRAGCNLERKSGKAPPPRLTTTQRKLVLKLMEVHGEDFHAMMLDRKLNPMQHSEGQLKKLFEGYHFWKGDGAATRHDFWGPQKPYKKL